MIDSMWQTGVRANDAPEDVHVPQVALCDIFAYASLVNYLCL